MEVGSLKRRPHTIHYQNLNDSAQYRMAVQQAKCHQTSKFFNMVGVYVGSLKLGAIWLILTILARL
jgi:hypothetical protein